MGGCFKSGGGFVNFNLEKSVVLKLYIKSIRKINLQKLEGKDSDDKFYCNMPLLVGWHITPLIFFLLKFMKVLHAKKKIKALILQKLKQEENITIVNSAADLLKMTKTFLHKFCSSGAKTVLIRNFFHVMNITKHNCFIDKKW